MGEEKKKKIIPHKCDNCGKGWDCGGCGEKITSVRCPECQDKTLGVTGKTYYGKYTATPSQTAAQMAQQANEVQLQASQVFSGWANPQPVQDTWVPGGLGQLFSETIITGNR